jgi:hypothetical protein
VDRRTLDALLEPLPDSRGKRLNARSLSQQCNSACALMHASQHRCDLRQRWQGALRVEPAYPCISILRLAISISL